MADTWQVVSQRQTSDITPDGRFQEVMEVTAQTTGGTTFTVRVPIQSYQPDVVRAMIEERAAQILEVETL